METITSELAGIYLHWPFCARKCPYCDFYTFGREHPQFDKSAVYLRALLDEIETLPARSDLAERPYADTVYFGGGTPSLLEPTELSSILKALRGVFDLAENTEITLEVNPTAAEANRLGPAMELGVNRLSIGCQSFKDPLLKVLGRDHDASTARKVLALVRQLGYRNISLDLMFGLPGQTLQDFQEDLEEALSFQPEHFSAYGLTFHEGTPFKRWRDEGKFTLPEGEVEAAQFEFLVDRMTQAGYVHYEISNWSRPNLESRHNSKYWSPCDIFAFGASAHGVRDGRRFSNPRNLDAYLGQGGQTRVLCVEEPPPENQRAAAGEILMLGLRRVSGVSWSDLNSWIHSCPTLVDLEDVRAFYAPEFELLASRGLIEAGQNDLRLTRRGLLFADNVLEAFF